MNGRYDLIVFDWDGTLMDSVDRIVACVRAAITELGLAPRSRQQISNIIGLGLHEAITTLYAGSDEAFVARMTASYRRQFLAENPTPSRLFDGAGETVRTLHDAGYLLGVATGKGRRGLDENLVQSGLGSLFHATRCADDAPSKPHPGMLEQLMEVLGATPERTLMVGDTIYDLEMARNAGADSVAVSYGVHDRSRLERVGPLACLDRPGDLLAWLRAPVTGTFDNE